MLEILFDQPQHGFEAFEQILGLVGGQVGPHHEILGLIVGHCRGRCILLVAFSFRLRQQRFRRQHQAGQGEQHSVEK